MQLRYYWMAARDGMPRLSSTLTKFPEGKWEGTIVDVMRDDPYLFTAELQGPCITAGVECGLNVTYTGDGWSCSDGTWTLVDHPTGMRPQFSPPCFDEKLMGVPCWIFREEL